MMVMMTVIVVMMVMTMTTEMDTDRHKHPGAPRTVKVEILMDPAPTGQRCQVFAQRT